MKNLNALFLAFFLSPFLSATFWTKEEDKNLKAWVKEHGTGKWKKIGNLIPRRAPKQCKERWELHINPKIDQSRFSVDEEKMVIELMKSHGRSWSEIARLMPGRTALQVKNSWNKNQRKRNSRESAAKKRHLNSEYQGKDEEWQEERPRKRKKTQFSKFEALVFVAHDAYELSRL